jgi:L-ascorbate metabolism protein UlaG (beta-lactamase superfamily)
MKRVVSVILALTLILGLSVCFAADNGGSSLLKNVQHLKNSTIRMEAGAKVIYFDPVWLDDAKQDADIIFITHTHGDHYSLQDIKKLMKKDAVLVVPEDGVEAAQKEGITNIKTVVPNKNYYVGGIRFKTVPMYNIDKPWHPRSSNWVGYIVTANNADYYFAGDTDVYPEMRYIKADVAFLPVGGTYTMNSQEAIEAAKLIDPEIAVPIHFIDVAGNSDDAVNFVRGLDNGTKGVVLKDLLNGVSLLKQSTIRIQGNKTIYFDPMGIDGEPKDADVIFISHSHGDHFSIDDIKKLAKDNTVFIIPGDCVKQVVDAGFTNIVTVSPSKSYEVDGLKFSTVPAYNIDKDFHRKDSNWLGFIVNVNGISYYFAGDTDNIPEMKDIKASVVFLPVGGTYTMTSSEAVEAANIMNPLFAVPMHYQDVVGTKEDAQNFVKDLNDSIKGVLLK